MSKEKEMKQHLQQYDKDALIELYLQKDFDTKQQLADTEAQNKRVLEKLELLVKDNQDLQQQLAEKDKEIEEYNNYFKSFGCKDFAEFQELIGLTKISANDKDRDDIIRHQICDGIRHRALLLNDYCPDHKIERMYGVRKCLLDQIEKGE